MSVRLFVEADLVEGGTLTLNADQAAYLGRVMRLGPGARLLVFNGCDGEWRAEIAAIDRKGAALALEAQTRAHRTGPDLTLLFAPVKRQATDWIVEKATELGVCALAPVLTRRTMAETVRVERLAAIAREAAEQCERLDVPAIAPPRPLSGMLDGWDAERPLLFADEAGAAPAAHVFTEVRGAPGLAILVGPEGGFDPAERALLRGLAFVRPFSLGPRILRAETAAVAALALAQAVWGDWAALPHRPDRRT